MKARALAAGMVGALVAAGLLVAPAFGAAEQSAPARRAVRRAAVMRDLSGFTPAAADPRLAAMFARGGLDLDGLRFTPADTHRERAVTVAVRARTVRAGASPRLADTTTAVVGLAPISYSLGAGLGWRRVAITGDAARVDMAGQPGGHEAADVSVSYAGARLTGRVKATADRPFAGMALIDGVNSYSLDVGGSYALGHRLDLTAGVRYRTDREQLAQLSDGRHDSQAVYIGTAFHF